MKAAKITFGLFSSGFVLFSLYKYFYQKKISKQQILKIIKKISNQSVHFMFQRYDSQNKIKNQKLEKNEIIIQKSNLNDIDEIENEDDFDNEVLYVLLHIENEKIKELEISNEEFQQYLLEYEDEEPEIKKYFDLIQKVIKSFKQRKLPEINFGFIIPEKYLEIISNIFYFNLKKTIHKYYEKLNNMNENISFKEKNEIFNLIYSSNLKNTRNEITEFFGINKDNNLEINNKLALRIFPFYYSKENNLRKEYEKINANVNILINKILKSKEKIDTFINENSEFFIKDPVDKIIDFEEIIKDFDSNGGDNENEPEEVPYEDQCD